MVSGTVGTEEDAEERLGLLRTLNSPNPSPALRYFHLLRRAASPPGHCFGVPALSALRFTLAPPPLAPASTAFLGAPKQSERSQSWLPLGFRV